MTTSTALTNDESRSTAQTPSDFEMPQSLPDWTVTRWYAAHTSANHEKRVAEQLCLRAVEHFLPLYLSVRRWKDRRVTLQLPLFPGYVFVRIALRDRLNVLEIPSVARLVGSNGLPTFLEDNEVEKVRRALSGGVRAAPHPYLTEGRKVRITAGPLAGQTGILVCRKGARRVVLSMDSIQRSILVDVEA
ncbi:MAG TPA: UpxY family transcription antiterminator, partial [Candidatus Acidoferrales bacterium]|nr:UpxY family transcription antiterminator [Candidatus Acidoferrales bacterium]